MLVDRTQCVTPREVPKSWTALRGAGLHFRARPRRAGQDAVAGPSPVLRVKAGRQGAAEVGPTAGSSASRGCGARALGILGARRDLLDFRICCRVLALFLCRMGIAHFGNETSSHKGSLNPYSQPRD